MRRFALFVILALQFASIAWSQPTIVLRDFSQPKSTVAGYDEDGVRLTDGTIVSWDRIAQVQFEPADQARADQLLQTIGQPLFQVRWRLQIGDFGGAEQAAKSVPNAVKHRRSEAALLIHLADMAAKIEQGDLLLAAIHWVRALDLMTENPTWRDQIPENLRRPSDQATMLHQQIIPVWTADSEAMEFWPQVEDFSREGKFTALPPIAQVYLVTIAIDLRQFDIAKQWLILAARESPAWSAALTHKLLIESGDRPPDPRPFNVEATDWPDDVKAVAIFWLAAKDLGSPNIPVSERAAIDMLSIPAKYQTEFPELAAEALAAVAQRRKALGDEVSAEKLYKEIQFNYSRTNAARRLTIENQRNHEQSNANLRTPGK